MEAKVFRGISKHHSKSCQSFCSQCFLSKNSSKSNVSSSRLFHLWKRARIKLPHHFPHVHSDVRSWRWSLPDFHGLRELNVQGCYQWGLSSTQQCTPSLSIRSTNFSSRKAPSATVNSLFSFDKPRYYTQCKFFQYLQFCEIDRPKLLSNEITE